MAVSPDILAAQIAYAARPYAVRWVDSHAALTNRFNTYDEAFQYVQEQWARVQKTIANQRYSASKLHYSYIETPDQRMPLAYLLLVKDVSSY
jgi:hypothetical protein